MRKLLLLFALIAGSVASYADDLVTAKVNDVTTIDVCLTNDASYVAFQMDITLPTGVSITAAAATEDRTDLEGNWDQVTIGGTDYDSGYKIVFNQIDATTNKWRIVGYSLGNHVIEGTSGEAIATLTISGADGVYEVDEIVSNSALANVIFVLESDLSEIALAGTVEAGVTKNKYDINEDEEIDAFDLSALLYYINNEYDEDDDTTYIAAYDLNDDGSIDVFDLSAWVYYYNYEYEEE